MARARRTSWLVASFLYAGLTQGATLSPTLATQLTSPGPAQDIPATLKDAAGVLADAARTPEARLHAAETLVANAEYVESRDAISTQLDTPLKPDSAGVLILRAIASRTSPSPRLFPIIQRRLEHAPPNEIPTLLDSLPAFLSRDAAAILVKYLASPDQPIAASASRALLRLSGRDDLADDPIAWKAWLDPCLRMTESQWRLELARSQARHAQNVEAARDAVLARLLEAQRQLHLATPPEARGTLLSAMLLDPIPEVRSLGFELIGRELSGGKAIAPEIGKTLVQLLASPDPSVRARAALMVRQISPDGAEGAVSAALAKETDPRAASDLLLAAARWPARAGVEDLLKWLETPGPARASATEACWTFARAGVMRPDEIDRALRVLAGMPPESLSGSAIALLGAFGSDQDRASLKPLLASATPGIRSATAEALVWYPEYRESILSAAKTDPDLFDLAARAQLLFAPTAAGYTELLALPHPPGDEVPPGVLRLAHALPAPELWKVVQATQDRLLKRNLLASLTSEERTMSEGTDKDAADAIHAGAESLCQTQLTEGNAEAALDTLTRTRLNGADAPQDMLNLRLSSLLVLGRLDLADEIDAPAEAWLAGLVLAKKKPHALRIIEAIGSRFGETLTPEQRDTLTSIRNELGTPETVSDKH